MSTSIRADEYTRHASRSAFSAALPPASVTPATGTSAIFSCLIPNDFIDRLPSIFRHLSAHGYAVIDAWDAEQETLKVIAEHFGQVQSHIRADSNGLVGISIDTVVNREWENFRSQYHGVSNEEFLPHTDGSYLHGLVHRDDKYIQLLPPGMLFLQCWQQAAVGGASILIDGQRVFEDMRAAQPEFAEILSSKGCVSYCRDDQIALDCAVFEVQPDGGVALRFRYDGTAYVADWALEAFHALQNDYWSDPRYEIRLNLHKGQILAIDNTRMLHGREAFSNGDDSQKRSLRRIWLARPRLPALSNVTGEHKERRALQRFQAYDILDATRAAAGSSELRLGIQVGGQSLHGMVRR